MSSPRFPIEILTEIFDLHLHKNRNVDAIKEWSHSLGTQMLPVMRSHLFRSIDFGPCGKHMHRWMYHGVMALEHVAIRPYIKQVKIYLEGSPVKLPPTHSLFTWSLSELLPNVESLTIVHPLSQCAGFDQKAPDVCGNPMCFRYTDDILRQASLWTRIKALHLSQLNFSASALQPLWTVQRMFLSSSLIEGQLSPPYQLSTLTFGSSLTSVEISHQEEKGFPLNFLTFCSNLRSIETRPHDPVDPDGDMSERSVAPLDNLEVITTTNIDHLVQLSRGASVLDPPSPFISLKELTVAISEDSQRTREVSDVFRGIRSLRKLSVQVLQPPSQDVPAPLLSMITFSSSTLRKIHLTLHFEQTYNEHNIALLNEALVLIKGKNCLESLVLFVNLDMQQTPPPSEPPSFTHLASLSVCVSSSPKTDFCFLNSVAISYQFQGYDEDEMGALEMDHWFTESFIDPHVEPLRDPDLPFRVWIMCLNDDIQ